MMASSTDKKSWKKMEFYDLLRLLQPVEAQWATLGWHLVPDEVEAIRANNFQGNAPDQAMFEAVKKWMSCNVRKNRTWCALLSVAKKWGDNTGPQFLKDNGLKEEDDPNEKVFNIMNWTKQSPLNADDWYGFAVELIGHNAANTIQANHGRGGNRACLRTLLSKWFSRTYEADRNWQFIVDCLEKIGGCVPVIEAITDNCLIHH